MDLTIGKAYLNLYDMPTTYFTGVWASVIGLLMFYIALTCMTFWSTAHLRFVEVGLLILRAQIVFMLILRLDDFNCYFLLCKPQMRSCKL